MKKISVYTTLAILFFSQVAYPSSTGKALELFEKGAKLIITVEKAKTAVKTTVNVASLLAMGMVVVNVSNARTAEVTPFYKNCQEVIDDKTNREIVVCEKEG